MHYPKAARPVEAQRRPGIESKHQPVAVGQQSAGQPVQPRAIAHGRESDRLHAGPALDPGGIAAGHRNVGEHCVRIRPCQPVARVLPGAIAQGQYPQQRRGLDALGCQRDVAANLHRHVPAAPLTPVRGYPQHRNVHPPAGIGPGPFESGFDIVERDPHRRIIATGRAAQADPFQVQPRGQAADPGVAKVSPCLGNALAVFDRDPAHAQQWRPGVQVATVHARVQAPVTAVAIEPCSRAQRHAFPVHPGPRRRADLAAIHPQPHVDPRDHGVQAKPRRVHGEAGTDHLQLAQPLERGERVAAGVLPGQAAHAPAPVVVTDKGQFQVAQAQLGQRAPGQQPAILRHQHFRRAD